MVGRPPKYRAEFVKQAQKLCELGATDAELADFFQVNVLTIHRWKHQFPVFCNALKLGKDAADNRVERSLYNRAVGYTFDSEKIMTVSQGANMGAEVERVPIKEHVPPDVTAQIFWLKNRRRGQWSERIENVLQGPDGGPVRTEVDLASGLAFTLKKGLKPE